MVRSLKKLPVSAEEDQGGETRKKGRAGKKRRIAIRKKHALEIKATETEKEKRARKNREKKLKKREKNRKMKTVGQGVEPKEASG